MRSTETITNAMDEKRRALLDNCTRALCGDKDVDKKLMDDATGGRFSNNGDDPIDPEQIKTLTLALRWLGLPIETKTRKRRTTKKASAGNGTDPVVKKRGRPKGSKNKTTSRKKKKIEITDSVMTEIPLEAKVDSPTETKTKPSVETPKTETPSEATPPIINTNSLDGVTFEGGALPQ